MRISSEQSGLTALKPPDKTINRGGDEPLEVKKLRLKKATKEFESFFVLQMLKAMRKTIPKSEMFDGGLGQDVYTSMFDEELARTVAGGSPNSLADMLYRSLEPHLEAVEAGQAAEAASTEPVDTSIKDIDRAPVNQFDRPGSIYDKVSDAASSTPKSSNPIQEIPESKPKITADPIMQEFGETIHKAAREFGVDPRLIYSVIKAESNGQTDAVSDKGARGLMQLVDSTAADMGVADSLDPHQNIIGGTKYLRQLLDRYDGNLKLALAAYNAGPGTVSKYNGVPPYRETQKYVENILAQFHSVKKQ